MNRVSICSFVFNQESEKEIVSGVGLHGVAQQKESKILDSMMIEDP